MSNYQVLWIVLSLFALLWTINAGLSGIEDQLDGIATTLRIISQK